MLALRFNCIYILTVNIFNNILYSNISVIIELVPPFFLAENNHIYRVCFITWEEVFVEYFPHHLPLGEASHPPVYLYSLCPQIHPVLRLSSVLGLLQQTEKYVQRKSAKNKLKILKHFSSWFYQTFSKSSVNSSISVQHKKIRGSQWACISFVKDDLLNYCR